MSWTGLGHVLVDAVQCEVPLSKESELTNKLMNLIENGPENIVGERGTSWLQG
jgi:hypothetical protein